MIPDVIREGEVTRLAKPPDMSDAPKNRTWNYHPDLPLADKSVFSWPPNPGIFWCVGWRATG